jgi:hypothetical protein
VKPLVSRFVDELHKTLIRLFTYVAVLGGVGVAVAAWLVDVPSISNGDRSEHKSEWIESTRPQPAFAMEAGEFPSAPRYLIRHHQGGGGRKDVLSWGSPRGPERYLRIEIYRPGTEHDGAAEPNLEAALRAGAFPVQGEARSVGSLPTKLGAFSVVELGGDAHGARRCLGLARAFAEPPLQIAAWHCDSAPVATVRTSIACALDQLTLLSAGGDARLAGLFARADQKRIFCGDKRPSLPTAPKPTDSLDVPAEPKLRGRFAMR